MASTCTPTTLELGSRIAALERAHHCFVAPGGQAALALVFLAYCRAGSHVLIPDSVYGPTAELAEDLLAGLAIEVERYDPLIGGGIGPGMVARSSEKFGPKSLDKVAFAWTN